jgi:hypothetical protein
MAAARWSARERARRARHHDRRGHARRAGRIPDLGCRGTGASLDRFHRALNPPPRPRKRRPPRLADADGDRQHRPRASRPSARRPARRLPRGRARLHALRLPDGLRLNDGKADRQGRYVSGTLATAAAGPNPPPGTLYRLSPDLTCEVLDHGITVANATCFSPAGDRLYFADSAQGFIWRYPYDGATGAVGQREEFIDVRGQTGSSPDGATVDAAGRLWVALVRTGQLGCFSDTGALLHRIDSPSSCRAARPSEARSSTRSSSLRSPTPAA